MVALSPIPSFPRNSSDREFMELAIDQMYHCASDLHPKVGVVLVKDQKVLAVGHRAREQHAERMAVESALGHGLSLRGATAYVTLEPCVEVRSKRHEPCSALLVREGVSTVVIGSYDPNPVIYRNGWSALCDAGVALRDFDPDLRERVVDLNKQFVVFFGKSIGGKPNPRFDYSLNEGKFEIVFSDHDPRSVTTRWTRIGAKAINAYGLTGVHVALAKNARDFRDIDDASALDYQQQVQVPEGDIVSFLTKDGCILCKILEVHSGPKYGSPHTSLRLSIQVRPDNITPTAVDENLSAPPR